MRRKSNQPAMETGRLLPNTFSGLFIPFAPQTSPMVLHSRNQRRRASMAHPVLE
jgi:hypothetical protein